MNKELIQKRFAKNLSTYNENAVVQKIMAQKLISLLSNNEYKNIFEIGCGTGILTQLAVEKLNFKTYTANDIVGECGNYIKLINPAINFVCNDIEKAISENQNTYDLIISNAVFQWVENLEELLKKLMAKLNPGGVLLFSTFGPKNFQEIYHVLGKTLPYYSKQEIEEMVRSHEYSISEELRVLTFNTPVDILKHIKLTGVNSLESGSWTKSDMFKFEKSYNKYCSQAPTLTYNPIYVKISNTLK